MAGPMSLWQPEASPKDVGNHLAVARSGQESVRKGQRKAGMDGTWLCFHCSPGQLGLFGRGTAPSPAGLGCVSIPSVQRAGKGWEATWPSSASAQELRVCLASTLQPLLCHWSMPRDTQLGNVLSRLSNLQTPSSGASLLEQATLNSW